MDQHELDMHARAAGFPDYQTWLAYREKQRIGLGGQRAVQQQQAAPPPQQQQPPQNFLQYLMARIHPGFAKIDQVGERYRQAQQGQRK